MKTMIGIAALALAGTAWAAPAAEPRRPNFLVIVADDLGWSDLGAYGGEIETPNLDALATGGVRFTGFHTAPTCSPTRAMLMSGVDNHEAGLGSMAETLVPAQRGQPGYEGYLNDRVASIAERLKAGGYRTIMSGKWHLGLTPERGPAARGFDRSYALLQGLGNHFGADQNDGWRGIGAEPTYREDGRVVRYPEGRYSADYFTDRLIGYLEEGKGDARPFFAYLPYTTPHWPLQAPPETIAKYRGRYDAGYEALRDTRLARQRALGLVPAAATPHPLVGVTPWATLPMEQRAIEARKMEVYAAMVDRMDQNVGRVVAALKRIGRYDDTVILFLADNGPEGSAIDAPSQALARGIDPKTLGIDNSLGNIGRANSYVGYGMGWAQANSGPSWLVKGYPTEGGIRTTAFASGAGVRGGRISNAVLNVTDVAPTLLDLARVKQSEIFAGHAVLPFEGHSLVPVLTATATQVRSADEPIGHELFYRRALRKGDWKAVYLPQHPGAYGKVSFGEGRWQLFDVARDPGETTDRAAEEPARLKALIADWDAYAKAKGVVVPDADVPLPPRVAGR